MKKHADSIYFAVPGTVIFSRKEFITFYVMDVFYMYKRFKCTTVHGMKDT